MLTEEEKTYVLDELAGKVLRAHAAKPGYVWYAAEVLPGVYYNADIDRLDDAYRLLEDRGDMERAGSVVSFFGEPKVIRRVTRQGMTKTEGHRE